MGSDQQSGEKRVIMNWAKPGRAGWVVMSPLEGLAGWLISGPPHRLDIRDRTEKAILAVGKSSTSLAKCSMVVMTVSKIG